MTILVVEGVTKIYRREGNIVVVDEKGSRVEAPTPDLELVIVIGERSHITSSAILTLLSQGIPLVFVSSKTDTYGVLFDVIQVGTTSIREVQYECFSSEYCRLEYAKPIIASKLKGLYNILRYEYKYYKDLLKDYENVKYGILETIESLEKASDIDELRVLEAKGSKYFWDLAVNLIPEKYRFTGRKPRGGDPVNSSIDFLYAVLYGITTKALVSSGLDPFNGLIHKQKSGRVSLTYDLSEVFKPIVVHSVIQSSRGATLKTFQGSRILKPKTIEVLVKHLYYRLAKESKKEYGRESIWYLPVREAYKFRDALAKQVRYDVYIYNPTT